MLKCVIHMDRGPKPARLGAQYGPNTCVRDVLSNDISLNMNVF